MNNLSITKLKRYKKLERFGLYLCGPIKDCTDSEMHSWRDNMIRNLIQYNIGIFDPTVRDYRGVLATTHSLEELEIIDKEIVTIDTEEIDASHAIVANCSSNSSGTSMEIYMAWHLPRLVIAVVPSIQKASPWVRHHSTLLVESYPDAIQKLREIFPTAFGLEKGVSA